MCISRNTYDVIMSEYADDNNAEDLILEIIGALENSGVTLGDNFRRVTSSASLILLLEAVNWAAKCINYDFYDYKDKLALCLLEREDIFCWRQEDEYGNAVLYAYHKETGTASFHLFDDFWDEVENWQAWDEWAGQQTCFIRKAPFQWPGIPRQDMAFELIGDDANLLNWYAYATRPRCLAYPNTA